MNEQISWDVSLVKKYSSSNHYKLLNQLKNEVKKYPLHKKKNNSAKVSNHNRGESKYNIVTPVLHDISAAKNQFDNRESNNNKSTISFNNSKNFSIYNNQNNESRKGFNENILLDEINTNDDSLPSSFKDRLNQIDMK